MGLTQMKTACTESQPKGCGAGYPSILVCPLHARTPPALDAVTEVYASGITA